MNTTAPLDGQRLYATTHDYITEVVMPAIGGTDDDCALAIAHDMLERYETTRDGLVDANHTGYIERSDVDFWEVVALHDALARATQAADEVDRLEQALAEAREVEQQAAREAVEAGATRYRVAQVMGRSQPTIKRWVP